MLYQFLANESSPSGEREKINNKERGEFMRQIESGQGMDGEDPTPNFCLS
jgi:hypothetical protein